MGRWIDELLKSLKKNIYLETSEGVVREGKLTGFTIRELEFNNSTVEVITELELNQDPMDRIPFDRLTKVEIY
jgi:hypothetical protein